jgi:hypothetical protein
MKPVSSGLLLLSPSQAQISSPSPYPQHLQPVLLCVVGHTIMYCMYTRVLLTLTVDLSAPILADVFGHHLAPPHSTWLRGPLAPLLTGAQTFVSGNMKRRVHMCFLLGSMFVSLVVV